MMLRRLVLSFAFLATLALASGPSLASAGSADDFIRKAGERAFTSLSGSISDAERSQRFREILGDTFDLKTIARFTLGRYWRVASPAERKEYTKLFEEFIVQAYSNRFRNLSGKEFRVNKTQPISARDKLVMSEVLSDGGRPPVRVGWRVRSEDEQLRIVDVMVEGVSMSVTQRDEFAAVIRNSGGRVEGLLTALREKTGAK